MSSFLGGGYDAPRTPSMSQGDEESIEESKLPESTVVGAGDSGGIDPHGVSWLMEQLNHGCSLS